MLRSDVEERLRSEHESDGYLFPDYEGFCFANVPHSIADVLGAKTGRTLPDRVFAGVDTDVENVVVVLIDGFGLKHWKRDRERHGFLRRLTERGTVTPLTSVYPSETAAAITTYHTGRQPAEHGVVGWNVYEPAVDEEFVALSFETKGGERPSGLDPDDVFDGEDLYPRLRERGVDVRVLAPFEDDRDGATGHAYDGLDDLGDALASVLARAEDPSYVFAYLPQVDHVSHFEGTESAEYGETLAAVCERLESALIEGVDADAAEDTLLVVTADHGHVDTDPDRNVDLSAFDALDEHLARRADGTPVRFAGSPRNVHLHLRDGAVETVRDRLLADLDARAFRREDALDRGLFGDREPSETFRRRLGDLVVTHRELGAWYGDAEPDELDLIGMHGGLHPDEMLVPFAAAKLSALRD